MIYVDPIQWIIIGGIITAVLCLGIGILWVEIQKEKWINLGRELEREDREIKFKKTKGTRRVNLDWATLAKKSVVKQKSKPKPSLSK